jgi:hypothetical protein
MPKDFYPELTALLLAAGWNRAGNAKGSHEKGATPTRLIRSSRLVQKAATPPTPY